jgi:siroheme synthase
MVHRFKTAGFLRTDESHDIIQALNKGRHVLRLKIGDPFVFGRGAEEILTFRKFGVEPTVIPVSIKFVWCPMPRTALKPYNVRISR